MNQQVKKRKSKIVSTVVIGMFLMFLTQSCQEEQEESMMSLAGDWTVQLESGNAGFEAAEEHLIQLPGILDEHELGEKIELEPALNNKVLTGLSRKYSFIGKAKYKKEVSIPQNWSDKPISLKLERVLWESSLFVDGVKIGSENSLTTPHYYDLTSVLNPGKHTIEVVVDNTNIYPGINVLGNRYPDPVDQDMAHAYTNHTQIKWNGLLGEISLSASQQTSQNRLAVHYNEVGNSIRVVMPGELKFSEEIRIIFEDLDRNELSNSVATQITRGGVAVVEIEKPEEIKLWDEFNPHLYYISVETGSKRITERTGIRYVQQQDKTLMVNGKRIFLRGNLECSIFPLTGYPPMGVDGWKKVIKQAKSYGLNHLRFHSWCPPKAAFEAADELGFYLQAELPHWSLTYGEDPETKTFLRREGDRIMAEYGNHPSFLLFAMGNELQGDLSALNELTEYYKNIDNRRLYATTSFSFQRPTGLRPEPADEFFVTQYTEKGWIRGQGVFNQNEPNFSTDYSENSDYIPVPLISHEIGQYSVYPRLEEMEKYTGNLQPINFQAIKQDLDKKGLIGLAPEYTKASGTLAAILYKEEIERAMKTEAFDGFQLLQLQDFPGQGTALVGLLDAFWESKGIIEPEDFRNFCSEVVPLVRFEKATYYDGEQFEAIIEVANFFKPFEKQKISWEMTDQAGNVLASDNIQANLRIGNNKNLGNISVPIITQEAKKFVLKVSLEGTEYQNQWSIWVYPSTQSIESEDVLFIQNFDRAIASLEEGKKVLFNPKSDEVSGVTGRFVPVFWSPVHFPDQPGTMGLLINEDHPSLADFPTSFHTDWQWWDLVKRSKAVELPNLEVSPIVRVIDNFVTNRNLAAIFEAKVGSGQLLFCSMDLHTDLENRLTARQLRQSLIKYMESASFDPQETMSGTTVLGMKK